MKPHENLSLVDMTGEIWVDIYGFDGIYEVSNLGRIKSLGRFVPIRNGERWVKEKIRKQVLGNGGRLTCPLSMNSQSYSINLPVVVFQSFNRDITWDISTHCIMHINKIATDNRLSNLKLTTISESHSVNAKKGLLPHLIENNKKLIEKTNALTHRTCKDCNIEKPIELFRRGSFRCKTCRSTRAKKAPSYLARRKNIIKEPIFFRNKEFAMPRHFSNYVFENFGVKQRTVEARLKAGYTPEQCIIKKDFKTLNKYELYNN